MWTLDLISKVYRSPSEGRGLQDGETPYKSAVESKFQPGTWRRRNGWVVSNCVDSINFGLVIDFLIPILNPEKQARVSLALATTVLVSLEEKEQINWTQILYDVIHVQVRNHRSRLEKRLLKFSYLAVYVSHLYWYTGCFSACDQSTLLPRFPSKEPMAHQIPSDSEPAASAKDSDLPFDSQLLDTICEILSCTRKEVVTYVTELRRDLDIVTDRGIPEAVAAVSSSSAASSHSGSDSEDRDVSSVDATKGQRAADECRFGSEDLPEVPLSSFGDPPFSVPEGSAHNSAPVQSTTLDKPTFVSATPMESAAPKISRMEEWSPIE